MKRKIFNIVVIMLSFYLIATLIWCTKVDASSTTYTTESAWLEDFVSDSDELELITRNLTTNEVEVKSLEDISEDIPTIDNISAYIPSNLQIAPEPRVILGDDNRIRISNSSMFPYSAVAKVLVTFPNGDIGQGTAAIISDRIAITAAHVVYDQESGGAGNSVTLFPGTYGGSYPYGSTQAYQYTLYGQWINNRDAEYDWAILYLDNDIASRTGHFGVSWYQNVNDLVSTPDTRNVCGYPSELEGAKYQYRATGSFFTSSTDRILKHNMDTTEGQSGSPIYLTPNFNIVGIHSGATSKTATNNQGSRINQDVFNEILYAINNQW